MSIVNEVVTKFKFIGSLSPQKNFNDNLKVSIGALTAFAAASKIAAAGAFAWASSLFDPIDQMANMAKETNNSVESMQAWGYAASQNNSSVQALSSSMVVLTRRAGQYAKFGSGPAKEAFEALNLSVKKADGSMKNSSDLMLDLSDKMQGLSEGEQLSMLRKLGIDASMLQTLRMTREEIQAMHDEAYSMGVVSQEDADAVGEFGGAITKLKYGMTSMQNMVAVGFAPMMTDVVNKFSDALAANRDWIVNGLKWLGNVIASVSGFITRMWPILAGIAAAFVVAKIATFGFAAALGVLFSPVVLITAAIVAILLIIDDLIVAFSGGKSVIGDFFQEFFGIDIVPILQGMVDAFKAFIGWIEEVTAPLFDYFKSMFKAITSLLTGDFDGAIMHLSQAFSRFGDFLVGVFERAVGAILSVGRFIAEMIAGFFGIDIGPALDIWISAFKITIGTMLDVAGGILTFFAGMFSAIAALFTGDMEGAVEIAKGAFLGLANTILDAFSNAFNSILGLWGSIAATIKAKAMDMLPDWAVALLRGTAKVTGATVDAVKDAGGKALGTAKKAAGSVMNFFGLGGDDSEDAKTTLVEKNNYDQSNSYETNQSDAATYGYHYDQSNSYETNQSEEATNNYIQQQAVEKGESVTTPYVEALASNNNTREGDIIDRSSHATSERTEIDEREQDYDYSRNYHTETNNYVTNRTEQLGQFAKAYTDMQPVDGGGEQDVNTGMWTPDEAVGSATGTNVSNSTVEQNIEMNVMTNDPQAAASIATDRLKESQSRAKNLAKRGGR